MKKILPIVLVLAVLAAAAIFYFRRDGGAGTQRHAADFVPASASMFVVLPDIGRTLERWKSTSLYEISKEPEWQAFTENLGGYLKEALPPEVPLALLEQLTKVAPGEFFLAELKPGSLTDFIGGLHYRGRKSDVKGALETLRAQFLSGMAAPKSEIVTIENTEVELVTAREYHLAFAYADDWFFYAHDVESMREMLKRYHGAAGQPPSLQADPLFVEAQQQTLAEPDAFWFVRIKEEQAAEKAQMEAQMLRIREAEAVQEAQRQAKRLAKKPAPPNAQPPKPNPAPPPPVVIESNAGKSDDYLPEIGAASIKLDGALIRDRVYARLPNLAKVPPMQNRALAFAPPDAWIFADVSTVGLEKGLKLLLREIGDPSRLLGGESKQYPDFFEAFGPEVSAHSQWDEGAIVIPTLFASVEVRDENKTRPYMERFTETSTGTGVMLHKVEDGTEFWTQPNGVAAFAYTVGRNKTDVVFGLNYASAALGVRNAKSGRHLGQSPRYLAAMKTVPAPEIGAIYVDFRQLIERGYNLVRPVVKFGIAGDPQAMKYLDPGKIPGVDTFTRHLQPIAVSIVNAPHGMAVESAGTLPLSAGLTVVASGGYWYAMSQVRAMRTPTTPPYPPPARPR